MRALSVLGFAAMAVAIAALAVRRELLTPAPAAIAFQAAAIALMIRARITFGRRSFHAAADATAGGLVTDGPYRFVRHPIYTAVCLFAWAGILANLSAGAALLGAVVLGGAVARMLAEERLIVERYPEYVEYARRTRRMVPYLF